MVDEEEQHHAPAGTRNSELRGHPLDIMEDGLGLSGRARREHDQAGMALLAQPPDEVMVCAALCQRLNRLREGIEPEFDLGLFGECITLRDRARGEWHCYG